jgi:hypothetical protein
MGNSASGTKAAAADTAHQGDDLDQFDGIETLGYRVLGVQPNSPAAQAGLVSFFDFIAGANGKPLLASGENLQEGEEYDDIDFPALLLAHKDKPVELCELTSGVVDGVKVKKSLFLYSHYYSYIIIYSYYSGLEYQIAGTTICRFDPQ